MRLRLRPVWKTCWIISGIHRAEGQPDLLPLEFCAKSESHCGCADTCAQSDFAHRQEWCHRALARALDLAAAGTALWTATGQRRSLQRWLQGATGVWCLCAFVFVRRHRTNLLAGRRTQAQQCRRAAAWVVEPDLLAHASLQRRGWGATGSATVRAVIYPALPSTSVAGSDTSSSAGALQATAVDGRGGRCAAERTAAHGRSGAFSALGNSTGPDQRAERDLESGRAIGRSVCRGNHQHRTPSVADLSSTVG